MDFAILEDRKFKSGPKGKIPQQGPRPDHIRNPKYDPESIDLPGLKLLGGPPIGLFNRLGNQKHRVLESSSFADRILWGRPYSWENRQIACKPI